MINYISVVLLLTAILMTAVGIHMSVCLNDTSKTSEQERLSIRPIGLYMVIICSILLGLKIIALIALTTRPEILIQLLKFKIIIGLIIILEIICITIGSIILSIDNDTTIDDETKNDKFSILSHTLITPGIIIICYVLYSFFTK